MGTLGWTGKEGDGEKPSRSRTYRYVAIGIVVECPSPLSSLEESAAVNGWPTTSITLGTPDYRGCINRTGTASRPLPGIA